ncbi:hypothetical protein Tco_1086088 [Tanacetum coccineum]
MAPKRATRSNTAPETTTTTTVTNDQLQEMIDQGITAALAARDANRSTNGDDSHISGKTSVEGAEELLEVNYQDFMKCQPLKFQGQKEVVRIDFNGFRKLENCVQLRKLLGWSTKINFSTCTLLAGALTWWNSHVRTVGHDVAYYMQVLED